LKAFVSIYATPNVHAAMVDWNEKTAHLQLCHIFYKEPSEDDLELQELTITELIAQFPDIVTAECLTLLSNEFDVAGRLIVYR
jgi:hypothetical protein